jgi:hypothetical protein
MASENSLQFHLERFALLSLEKQDRLDYLTSGLMHELDLDAGVIRFGDLAFPMQVLGTESDNTFTWLWAWADEQAEVPASLLQSAIQLRTWGQDLVEFTAPSVDLDQADGTLLALIASEVCKASCFYGDRYEGGSVFLLLYDRMIDNQPSFDRMRLLQRFSELVSRYDLNHWNTLRSYLVAKELSLAERNNQLSCELASGERLNAEFDDTGRLIMVNGAAFEA